MNQAPTNRHHLPRALVFAAAIACGCSVDDATLLLFGPPAGEGGGGNGGAGGAPATSTSSGGRETRLDCGDTTCPRRGNSACCWDGVVHNAGECVEGPPNDATCDTQLSASGLKTRIECQLPVHCGLGQVCCAARAPGGADLRYTTVTCAARCDWPDAQLCDPETPVCPVVSTPQGMVQTVCARSQRFPDTYFVCGVP